MPESATVFGNALRFVNKTWEMLLVLNEEKPELNKSSRWGRPAGGVEEGETIEQALFRETEEETRLRFSGCRELFREPTPDGSHENIELLLLGEPEGTLAPGEGVRDAQWVPINEIKQLPEGFYQRQFERLQRVITMINTDQFLSKLVKKNAQSRR